MILKLNVIGGSQSIFIYCKFSTTQKTRLALIWWFFRIARCIRTINTRTVFPNQFNNNKKIAFGFIIVQKTFVKHSDEILFFIILRYTFLNEITKPIDYIATIELIQLSKHLFSLDNVSCQDFTNFDSQVKRVGRWI